MNRKTNFECESYLELQSFVIEEMIELPEKEFENFCNDLWAEYPFVERHLHCCYEDEEGNTHCLLVLQEGGNDGILVNTEGYEYAKYTSYLPNARQMVQLYQYPSLTDFNRKIAQTVDAIVEKGMQEETGTLHIPYEDLQQELGEPFFHLNLVIDLLYDRDEVVEVQEFRDEICIQMKPGLCREQYRQLESDEVNVIMARHLLFLYNEEGGKQADFSDCELNGINLKKWVLDEVNFSGAKLVNMDFSECNLQFSDFLHTKIIHCDFSKAYIEHSDWQNVDILESKFNGAEFQDCNLSNASFQNTDLEGTTIEDCCIERLQSDQPDQSIQCIDSQQKEASPSF